MIHAWMGSPRPTAGDLSGPAYTVRAPATAMLLELPTPVFDENGKLAAPVDVVLESDSRRPRDKHDILELYVKYGARLPDTPPMALHRGRIDLPEEHLRRGPRSRDRHARADHGRALRRAGRGL